MIVKTTEVKISSLNSHPRNVRQGDIGAISESLLKHGQYRPIVVQQSTNNILAGNHTWKAAKQLGWEKILVTLVDVDDDQAMRILLMDNRVNDLATYDDGALADLLKTLAATETEFDGTGFDGDDLDDLLFRLNGSSGFLSEGITAAERTEGWAEKGVRTIILPYLESEWEIVSDGLKALRDKYGADNNAEVVAKLVANANS